MPASPPCSRRYTVHRKNGSRPVRRPARRGGVRVFLPRALSRALDLSRATSWLALYACERLARFVGAGEIRFELQRLLERRARFQFIAGLRVRQSEMEVIERILRRFRDTVAERRDRFLRASLLVVDPAERVVHRCVVGKRRLRGERKING